ncbi:MAG: CBU_0592 family membrane protein [Planctomycetota bacterium]
MKCALRVDKSFLVSLMYDFNLPAFIIEAFWLLISIYGVVRYFSCDRSKPATGEPYDSA